MAFGLALMSVSTAALKSVLYAMGVFSSCSGAGVVNVSLVIFVVLLRWFLSLSTHFARALTHFTRSLTSSCSVSVLLPLLFWHRIPKKGKCISTFQNFGDRYKTRRLLWDIRGRGRVTDSFCLYGVLYLIRYFRDVIGIQGTF